nr:ATP-binding protein [Devosia sp.]
MLPLSSFTAAVISISTFGTNTPIWVSNALVVTALLRNKPSTWPILLLLGAVAGFAADLVTDVSFVGLGLTACDVFEILVVAILATRAGVTSSTDSIWRMAKLAAICLLVPTLSAAGGAGLLVLVYDVPFLPNWTTWYLGTACGLLTITPLLLSWTDQARRGGRGREVIVQMIVLAGLVGAVGYADFNLLPDLHISFPFLLLATFSGRLLGATTAAATLAAVAIWSTLLGHGHIAEMAPDDPVATVERLQLYIVVVLFSTLPVAAILEQRDRLMEKLRETTKAAQAAATAKSEFLAMMSHEIRTPMTSVLGMTDLLMDADLPAKERGYIGRIRTSGLHLLALINDVLDFSRAEAGKLDLERIDFSLPEVLEHVRSLLAPQAADRGLELRFERDAHSPPMLMGDPTRLSQVLINLVGNAIKFTQRGSVTVSVSRLPKEGERERFRFEVRDTGIGISREKQAVLFSAFSQADSSTTRQYGGSGLGLAICKKLVEAKGGQIGVESVEGVGSCFWFEVPLALSAKTPSQAKPWSSLAPGPPRRVLLVEDVETNQLLITDMLRSHGHDVTLAVNGLEAVALATRERFDVVLMDVQMPVMDGVEATRQIRRLPAPAGEVPVLALTANVMAAERERYLAAGMNGTLTKPIDWSQLFEALARYGGSSDSSASQATASGPGADPALLAADAAAALGATPADIDSPIDPAVFNRLRRLQGGSGDLTVKLAELFVRDTGKRLTELRDAVHLADAPAVARMAHAIKGSAANLGAQVMVRICAGIETSAEAADLETTPARLNELQREFTRACDALAFSLAAP